MSVLSLQNISKSFGAVKALQDISFQVQDGEIFGLIGPDGAGKTTVFRILTTLLEPDAGKAEVLGNDAVLDYRKIRAAVGYMPGRFSLYQDLTVEENLQFFASVFGTSVDENYDLIKPIYSQLEPFRSRLAGALSGGMKQKLALSCALVHKPSVLFLDEPTTGVDAVSRKEFWEMLHRLREEEISILVSTPYMDEAEQCDRIGLLQQGRLLSIDTPQAITGQFDNDLWAIKSRDKYKLIQVLRGYHNSESVQPFGASVHYSDMRDEFDTEELISYLQSEGIKDPVIQRISPHIEDTFMRLMEREVSYR